MNDAEAQSMTDGSWHNRAHVKTATLCGCFHCLNVFPAGDVTRWVDDDLTALCPRCGVDAVLPGVTAAGTLRHLHESRFGRPLEPSAADWNAPTKADRRPERTG